MPPRFLAQSFPVSTDSRVPSTSPMPTPLARVSRRCIRRRPPESYGRPVLFLQVAAGLHLASPTVTFLPPAANKPPMTAPRFLEQSPSRGRAAHLTYISRRNTMIFRNIQKFLFLAMLVTLMGAAPALHAQNTMVVTSSNASPNQLLVYNSSGALIQTLPTGGNGGVAGNSGGIEARGSQVAVVNFGSNSVSMFEQGANGFWLSQSVPTISSPVSVAFGGSHLYILGTTTVESHRIFGSEVSVAPDGVVDLLVADGSAAQVGVLLNQLIITEKSNMIETVNLLRDGSASGVPTMVANIPSNVNAPFGLVTRGNDAYVTIAHANEISLVRNGAVLTVTGSGTQHAPCWLTLVGPFLFSSNSPSLSVSKYAAFGQKIIQDAAVAASLNGSPTDIASGDGVVAVVDGSGAVSHLSVFGLDEDGNLTLKGSTTISAPANGVAVMRDEMRN